LNTILQKLNWDESGANAFVATLRGRVVLEADVRDLATGFAFPAAITGAPNFLPIEYDEKKGVLRFGGIMTEGQRDTLLTTDRSRP
jgi:hypothetical protein